MLLGKRPRPPMKRTTSVTEFTLEIDGSNSGEATAGNFQPFDPHNLFNSPGSDQRYFAAAAAASAAPRLLRRNSAESEESAHFLRACSLCKRRLIPGRDIYMYRGDSAFCSSECRQQQMVQDERKEKCSLVSKKESATTATSAKATTAKARETVAAV